MNLIVDIAPELESRLREEAAKCGVDPGEYVANALNERLRPSKSNTPCLSANESRLIEVINRGLSEQEWNRYYELIEKRRSESLTVDEGNELIETSKHIEQLNVRRIECLAELAQLRGTTLPKLMEQLGIVSPPVI